MNKIKKYRQLGSKELLDKLPEGETMSHGYLTETFISESDILQVLMDGMRENPESKALFEKIGEKLNIT